MARTDTLGNFLTDVAEAIREKEGTTEKISASEFDTRISNLSGSENLDEELNRYGSELEEQNVKLDDIVRALRGKAAGGGEYIDDEDPGYIKDGLVAWFDGSDDLDASGHWVNRIGDEKDYIYASSTESGPYGVVSYNQPTKSLGSRSLHNLMTYSFRTSKDYYASGYTYETVGRINTEYNDTSSSGCWFLTANVAASWGIGVVETGGRVAFINTASSTSGKTYTGYYRKLFGAAIHTKSIGTGSSPGTTFDLEASVDGEPYFKVKQTNSSNRTRKNNSHPVLCYYATNVASDSQYRGNGELCCLRIYNRRLSEEEIAHNHEIDKKRFKLHDYVEESE